MDGLSRLTRTEEGTWTGSAITSRSRDELWTLTRTGNWSRNKIDLNGDGDFVDSGEQDDTQAFNDANELLTRDTDSNTSVDLTLGHDAVGNLTDDGNAYKYDYDGFGRMVRVKDRLTPFATIAEYVYDGLGHRISWRYDANVDGYTNGSDPWYHFAYDESWRIVALYRGSDTTPKEIFTNHQPGGRGVRGASGLESGLDATILRDKDANSTWTSAADGTREERVYYCQNWRGDVVSLLGVSAGAYGVIRERVTYSSYGVPQGLSPGDLDNDADCDAADETLWTTLSGGSYDVRADLDLDGDMDITDEGLLTGAANQGFGFGRGVLDRRAVRSPVDLGCDGPLERPCPEHSVMFIPRVPLAVAHRIAQPVVAGRRISSMPAARPCFPPPSLATRISSRVASGIRASASTTTEHGTWSPRGGGLQHAI